MCLRDKYLSAGFLSPLRIISAGEASEVWQNYGKYVQSFGKEGKLEGDARFRVHVLAPWAYKLVTNPTLVATVQTLLNSRDILCWSTDLCLKAPNSPGFFSWHQDSTYSGLSPPHSVLTAWLALTPTNRESGCLQVLPTSHLEGQLEHQETKAEDNLLSLGQTIPQHVVENLKEKYGCTEQYLTLEPGEVSFHHWQCVHRSGPNTSNGDRVGLAIRFMTPQVGSGKVVRERATLVSGCLGENWDQEPVPTVEYGEKEKQEHQLSMKLEKENYFQGTSSTDFK